jgi:hypothetical protein
MIPQLAHQPRLLSQQFGSPGFAVPPFEPLPPPRLSDRLAPLPFRNVRNVVFSSSSLAPPHVAYPVENQTSRGDGSAASQALGGQYHDPSEHMLRRKTPNGTLAAGYDGTPVQWSSKAPALKHVLLPLSVSSDQQVVSSPIIADERRLRQRANSSGWNYQQTRSIPLNSSIRMNSDPGNWTYVPPHTTTPRNFLDHLSIQQATNFYPNNGMQIPTVLQPSYQPAPGPTASNDGGLYGPYWPDGKFVPYRPAAYRNEGQHHQARYDFDVNRGFQQQSNSPVDVLTSFRQPSYSIDPTHRTRIISFPSPDTISHSQDIRFTVPSRRQHVPENTPDYIYSPITDGSRTPTAHSMNRANNSQFKEKTLSWAHRIYVDLLAFLNQSKKQNRQPRHSHGFRTFSKSSIYPKPPRQPASTFGDSDHPLPYNISTGNVTNTRKHNEAISPGSNRATPISSFDGWQTNTDSIESRYSRTSGQDMPHYAPPFQSSYHVSSSPLSKAKEALEMLTTLCEHSGWCWIDGMLLGGCLAYGLEEYHKALEWYSNIIAIDPK